MGREEKGTAREDKLKALDAALSQIEKQYGKGSVMKLGDTSHMQNRISCVKCSVDGELPQKRKVHLAI